LNANELAVFKGLVKSGLFSPTGKLYSHQAELLRDTLPGKKCIITSGTKISSVPERGELTLLFVSTQMLFFLEELKSNINYKDIIGILKSVQYMAMETLLLFRQILLIDITVRNFVSDKYNQLVKFIGNEIAVFNLRKNSEEFSYFVTLTTIYEKR